MLPQISKCDCVATNLSCDRVATEDTSCPFERRSLLEELAAKGVRLTAQRRAVVESIQDAGEHLDASALLTQARIRQPNIDRATVYRTIDLLKRLRLIDELDLMHLKGEKHFYEVKTGRDHVHLACFQCGRIEEFSSIAFEKLKSELATQTGFEVRVTRLEVGGRCRTCSAKMEELPKH
jgi:Fur family transcriptional regulator, ferric uptake regulator